MSQGKTIADQVVEDYQPKATPLKNEEKSGYKPLDSLFVKYKTFIIRSTGEQKELLAGWRKYNIKGRNVVLIKGEEVSKEVVKLFGEKAELYLEKIKSGKKKDK